MQTRFLLCNYIFYYVPLILSCQWFSNEVRTWCLNYGYITPNSNTQQHQEMFSKWLKFVGVIFDCLMSLCFFLLARGYSWNTIYSRAVPNIQRTLSRRSHNIQFATISIAIDIRTGSEHWHHKFLSVTNLVQYL